jgi:Cytochrome P450
MPFGFGAYRCMGETVATIEAMYCLAMMLPIWDVEIQNPGPPQMNGNITLSPKNLEFVLRSRMGAEGPAGSLAGTAHPSGPTQPEQNAPGSDGHGHEADANQRRLSRA